MMMKRLWSFTFLILLAFPAISQMVRTRDALLMGGRFDITIVATDSITAEKNIDTIIAEISRIENLISDWIPASQVSLVNRQAGIAPVKVDRELLELTERAIAISQQTNGAFDISFAAMEKIWRFDGSMTTMPHRDSVKKAVAHVGYKNIEINRDSSTIFLTKKGMKIGFGALGEGYAVDKCRAMMEAKGVNAGIINATGDIQAWGTQPDGQPWNIGVTDPFNKGALLAAIPLRGGIATSGNYEKYALINNKRYAHIIDPRTGYPASGLTSVTVTGPGTEMCNALSTSVMVLGKGRGRKLLKRFPQYQYLIITDKGKRIVSKGLKLEYL